MSRVLFIEDDPDDLTLELASVTQAHLGFEPAVARNGADAMDFLERVSGRPEDLPAAVVLDVGLPDADGFAILRWIRANPVFDAMPVIVVSAGDFREKRVRAVKLGAQEFRAKPVGLSEFQGLIEAVRRHAGAGLASPA